MGILRRGLTRLKENRFSPWWVSFLGAQLVRLLRLSYRVRIEDPDNLFAGGEFWPVIFVLWHNRILFLADCFPRWTQRHSTVIVSASRDGEYAAAFIRHFGLGVIRGSSSRGGLRALRELKKGLESGVSPVITLDGPRGPRYEAQPGAAVLAQLSDRPIVPLSLNASRRWELRSWDGTQIPKPFAKVELRIGPCLRLPSGPAAPRDRDQVSALIREALMGVTDDTKA